jgi:hypothetical protein
MGSASVSAVRTRQLTVVATDLPTNSTVEVVQGMVDYAGNSALVPDTSVIASYSSADLAGGHVVLPIDSTVSSFVRTQVVDSTGALVAFSNPSWLLRQMPPLGIPGPRAC